MQKIDLIVHGTLVPMVDQEILPMGALAIDKGIIIDCGPMSLIMSRYQSDVIIGSHDMMILPGFINGHTHVGMTLLRGAADDANNLNEWLNDYIFPLEKRFLSEDFVYWSTVLACCEMIQSGITTFADMYFFENSVALAVDQAGMRALLGETIFVEDDIKHAQDFYGSFKDNNGRIRPAFAPHSLYSCDAETLIKTHAFCQKHGIPFIIHVAEQYDEVSALRQKVGLSPAEYMQSLGILSSHVIIAHGVHFSETDLTIIAQYNASIIYNPVSNMRLGSGIAHVASMKQHGISVGLGTDGAASNNALDFFSEMKAGALLQNLCVTDYCKPLTPFEIVKLATCDGARALKMENTIGTIEVGKRADIILIASNSLHQLPSYDIFSQLVYASAARDVKTVIVNGKILMHNGQMITLADKIESLYERIAYYKQKIKDCL